VRALSGEAAAAVARPPGPSERLWIDVTAQTPEEMERLGQGFGFHPLTLEDCLHFDQRPKVEEYANPELYLFLVIHTFRAQPGGAPEETTLLSPGRALIDGVGAIEPLELHAFLGSSYLVTVHQEPIPALDVVWRRAAAEPELLGRGCDFVYYQVADGICDGNFPVLEQMGDVLDDIEEAVLERPERRLLDRIYQLRKALVTMRRVLSPQRDVLGHLSRYGGSPVVTYHTAPYFRDVYDHLVRITEAIDSGRDLLGNCVDAYLSAVGQRTNDIVKQLTILSAVMLPLTFLSGFFGMNFEALPFRSTPALVVTLVLMFFVVPGGMVLWFRRKGWI
jgi:magnesium transporter